MIAIIEDAGFIYGSYALTFAAIGWMVWRAITSGRRLGKQIPDDDKYWT